MSFERISKFSGKNTPAEKTGRFDYRPWPEPTLQTSQDKTPASKSNSYGHDFSKPTSPKSPMPPAPNSWEVPSSSNESMPSSWNSSRTIELGNPSLPVAPDWKSSPSSLGAYSWGDYDQLAELGPPSELGAMAAASYGLPLSSNDNVIQRRPYTDPNLENADRVVGFGQQAPPIPYSPVVDQVTKTMSDETHTLENGTGIYNLLKKTSAEIPIIGKHLGSLGALADTGNFLNNPSLRGGVDLAMDACAASEVCLPMSIGYQAATALEPPLKWAIENVGMPPSPAEVKAEKEKEAGERSLIERQGDAATGQQMFMNAMSPQR